MQGLEQTEIRDYKDLWFGRKDMQLARTGLSSSPSPFHRREIRLGITDEKSSGFSYHRMLLKDKPANIDR